MTDIDVRASVAIETLVPAVPTESERLAAILQHIAKASENIVRIENGLVTVTDPGLVQKIVSTFPHVRSLLETASSSSAVDLDVAESAATEAFELSTSMVSMVVLPAVESGTSTGSTTLVTIPIVGTSTASSTVSEDDVATDTAEIIPE
jgi:DNA mismatch repair ATPase MutS